MPQGDLQLELGSQVTCTGPNQKYKSVMYLLLSERFYAGGSQSLKCKSRIRPFFTLHMPDTQWPAAPVPVVHVVAGSTGSHVSLSGLHTKHGPLHLVASHVTCQGGKWSGVKHSAGVSMTCLGELWAGGSPGRFILQLVRPCGFLLLTWQLPPTQWPVLKSSVVQVPV